MSSYIGIGEATAKEACKLARQQAYEQFETMKEKELNKPVSLTIDDITTIFNQCANPATATIGSDIIISLIQEKADQLKKDAEKEMNEGASNTLKQFGIVIEEITSKPKPEPETTTTNSDQHRVTDKQRELIEECIITHGYTDEETATEVKIHPEVVRVIRKQLET